MRMLHRVRAVEKEEVRLGKERGEYLKLKAIKDEEEKCAQNILTAV